MTPKVVLDRVTKWFFLGVDPFQSGLTDEIMNIFNIYNNSSIDETLKLSRLKALSGIGF